MAYPQEVKDYSDTLFLTVNKEGQHKYSNQEILDKISQKFPNLEKFPDKRTVTNWTNTKDKVTKKSPKQQWDEGVRYGIQNAAREQEVELAGEEEFEIQIEKITSLRVGNAIKIQKKISEKLEENQDLSKEDIGALRASETIFCNLNLEKETTDDDIPIDIDYLEEVHEQDCEDADDG
ncbi:MAG: hypothetical protein K8E24_003150 [Methanobacterium paludis]|nr:hypothetical protein [Methanobacterium paludis]